MKINAATFSLGLTVLSSGLVPTVAQAEDLEQRVKKLETKLDAILELLQKQQMQTPATTQQTSTAASASSEPAPAPPASLRMGQLYLDVYTLSMNYEDWNRARHDSSAIPAWPTGVAAGSAVIEAPAMFTYGSFSSDAALAQFADAQALVQVVWNGVLHIERNGKHTFQLSAGKEEGSSGADTCRSSLRIEDETFVEVLSNNIGTTRRIYATEQGTVPLESGYYKFALYFTCPRYNNNVFLNYGATLTMAGPGDRAAKPIPPDLFGIIE
jgi:hypothetical protein